MLRSRSISHCIRNRSADSSHQFILLISHKHPSKCTRYAFYGIVLRYVLSSTGRWLERPKRTTLYLRRSPAAHTPSLGWLYAYIKTNTTIKTYTTAPKMSFNVMYFLLLPDRDDSVFFFYSPWHSHNTQRIISLVNWNIKF